MFDASGGLFDGLLAAIPKQRVQAPPVPPQRFRALGAGAYGSVFTPAIRCSGEPSSTHVSKVFKDKTDAAKEMDIAFALREVLAPEARVHFVLPEEWCKLNWDSISGRLPSLHLGSGNLEQAVSELGGVTLGSFLGRKATGGKLPARDAELVFRALDGIFGAVEALVAAKMIHFDIKPDNIVIPEDLHGLARLIDLGMADSFPSVAIPVPDFPHDERVAVFDPTGATRPDHTPPKVHPRRVTFPGTLHADIEQAYFYWPFEVTLHAAQAKQPRDAVDVWEDFKNQWDQHGADVVSTEEREEELYSIKHEKIDSLVAALEGTQKFHPSVLRDVVNRVLPVFPETIDGYGLGCALLQAVGVFEQLPRGAMNKLHRLGNAMACMDPLLRPPIQKARHEYRRFLTQLHSELVRGPASTKSHAASHSSGSSAAAVAGPPAVVPVLYDPAVPSGSPFTSARPLSHRGSVLPGSAAPSAALFAHVPPIPSPFSLSHPSAASYSLFPFSTQSPPNPPVAATHKHGAGETPTGAASLKRPKPSRAYKPGDDIDEVIAQFSPSPGGRGSTKRRAEPRKQPRGYKLSSHAPNRRSITSKRQARRAKPQSG